MNGFSKNLNQFSNNFRDLERKVAFGYIPFKVAWKIRKFSKGDLTTNQVRVVSTFLNNDPFNYSLADTFISSSDDADNFLVRIIGVNENKEYTQEDILLTGQTAVQTQNKYYSIWRMYNNSGTVQQGTIYAGLEDNPTNGEPANLNILCNIPFLQKDNIPAGQSLTGIFTIPAGYTGFMTQATVRAGKGVDAQMDAFHRPEGKTFMNFGNLSVYQGVAVSPLVDGIFREKTDFLPLAITSSGGELDLSYDLLLINNDYLNKHVG